MIGLRFQMALAGCLCALFVPGTINGEDLPDTFVRMLSDRLQESVRTQLVGQKIEEESSALKPIKVGRIRVGNYREKKSFNVSADAESFVLKLTKMEMADGVLSVHFESGCDISGRAHYSTPGAAIPFSLTSNYTARVKIKGQITAKVEFANLVASISNLYVPSMDVCICDVRWSNDGLDLLRDTIQSAISDRLNKEKPSALQKLNEEFSGQEFSKSLLDLR